MRIGLIDIDGHNLALMKLSAYCKAQGHSVEMTTPDKANDYDRGFASKVFSFTPMPELPSHFEVGGSGISLDKKLMEEIEHCCPDYALYNLNYSLGFLTRGCIRKCPWCLVPEKEGGITAHADIAEFARHRDVVLMDNNVLASEHGIRQIEKIAWLGLRVDFNQGLDARLIDNATAKLLAKVKWLKPIRLACDNHAMIPYVQKAVELLRWHNATPRRYFVYVLVKDIPDALERVRFLKGLDVDPFAQPYRDFKNGIEPTKQQRKFATWVNHKAIFKSVLWEDYEA
ncbi:MAG: radical SAM protein [Firmicutes bacterium]|nr:radical SAM protein [Bacillota bacterium]